MKTDKVSRIEIIDHSIPVEKGGGRVFVKCDENIKVSVELQDDDRTLKVFISNKYMEKDIVIDLDKHKGKKEFIVVDKPIKINSKIPIALKKSDNENYIY